MVSKEVESRRMARSEKSTRDLRLFVAVYPPAELVVELQARLAELELPRHRLTPREQVHLTLQFIGDVPVAELEQVLECVRRSADGIHRANLTPSRLIGLPRRGRTRLIAAETDAPHSLVELQRRLAAGLEVEPRRAGSARFLPHLTVCRFRTPTKIPLIETTLSAPGFPVHEVKVMRSILRPEGAEHSVLASFALQDDGNSPG
jgi:2'-5' RNA ligase